MENRGVFFRQSSTQYRLSRLRNSLYRRLTRNHLPLFFRGGDVISAQPLVNGVYEPEIKSLIENYAQNGHGDFFIDVGANIGLTTCQSGGKFRELHLFEPNPDCFNILKVNTRISLSGSNLHLHQIGLGETSGVLRFCVPHNNWGGAFVVSANNAYSEQTQAEKDGHKEFDPSLYSISEVRIEPAQQVFRDLFNEFIGKGYKAGVIKIDVEGYEKVVLKALAATLPSQMKVAVIFENWSKDIDFSMALAELGLRANLLRIVTIKHPISWLPKWVNAIFLLMKGSIDTVLEEVGNESHVGGLVLEVASTDHITPRPGTSTAEYGTMR